MKYISLTLLLCTTSTFLSAMECNDHMITLPSKKILLERLEPIKEYNHFIKNSSFIDKFADKNDYAPVVFMVLGFDIEKYHEKFKNDKQTFHLEMLKPKVITLVLQDYPDTIAFLKKENVLTEPVTLPSADILYEYLTAAKLTHLASKTHITQQLANIQKYPTEIFMIIDSQIDEYVKLLKSTPMIAKAFSLLIPSITKTILQKHPKAIEFLIDEGLLE